MTPGVLPTLSIRDLVETRDACVWLEEVEIASPHFSPMPLWPGSVLNTHDGYVYTLDREGEGGKPVFRRGEESKGCPEIEYTSCVRVGEVSYLIRQEIDGHRGEWGTLDLGDYPVKLWMYNHESGTWTSHAQGVRPEGPGTLYNVGGALVFYEHGHTWTFDPTSQQWTEQRHGVIKRSWRRHFRRKMRSVRFVIGDTLFSGTATIMEYEGRQSECTVIFNEYTAESGWRRALQDFRGSIMERSLIRVGSLVICVMLGPAAARRWYVVSALDPVSGQWSPLFQAVPQDQCAWEVRAQVGPASFLVTWDGKHYILHVDVERVREAAANYHGP
ncbi:hypothetical protein KIPB_000456 [Kipferlia bialata]|uniref:Uncharacterized protein n=1 Tax=Kipferlia bialata TaxID=797122 RepID=A0A9K3CNM3_9EUKA|nr:hypothetical protein KIPB_000456 [Kipferlia bialata]|eukprot:g456.t1